MFNFLHTFYNTIRRKGVSNVEFVFKDFLEITYVDASWFAFLFSMLYINIIALVFEA
jgi:hypothetical protein